MEKVPSIHSDKLAVGLMCSILCGHDPPIHLQTANRAEQCTENWFAKFSCSAAVCWWIVPIKNVKHQLHHQLLIVYVYCLLLVERAY